MSFWHRPLWQQLLALWLGAVLLATLLLWIDQRQPFKFFWLLPYPNWRLIWPSVLVFFRARPLTATALVAIPAVTLLGTFVLCLARLAPLLRRALSAG